MDAALSAEANIWAMHRDFARVQDAEVHDDPDVLWFTLPSPHAWLNGASWTKLSGSEADARIDSVTEAIHARGRNVLWQVTPSCEPRDLGRRLERRGFAGDPLPGMVADLGSLTVPLRASDLEIRQVVSPEDVLAWVNMFDRAMLGIEPRGDEHPWLGAFNDLALQPASPYGLFLGRADGEDVACSLAFAGGGAVGLYGIGTVPAARGRGYGSAVTLAGLVWGRERGERTGILHATEMGEPVYASLGFRRVWEMTHWRLPAPTA